MLCSNVVENLKNIVIVMLVLVMYTPNIIKCDQIAKNAIGPEKNATTTKKGDYEEYFIEHNVSHADAKRSFFETGIKLIDDKPHRWCMPCTDQINSYCLSGHLMHDHCCCDSRHGTEELPWITHSCYSGIPCHPYTGSCINYTEIRQCCCDRVLAKRYKSIYSNSMTTMTVNNLCTRLVCVFLLITSWSLH